MVPSSSGCPVAIQCLPGSPRGALHSGSVRTVPKAFPRQLETQVTIDWQTGTWGVTFRLEGSFYTDGYALATFGALSAFETPAEVGEAWVTAWEDSELAEFLAIAVTLTTVYAYNETQEATLIVNSSGENAGEMAPPNSCILVEKRTARRGRRALGRSFWPSMLRSEDVLESGAIDGTRLGLLQDAFTVFGNTTGGEGAPMAIMQNVEGNTPPIEPWPVVTSYVVDPVISTQRRRLRR